ncbi:MAG: hypothetical protein AAGI91_11875 [Bacteroidota bacterium]
MPETGFVRQVTRTPLPEVWTEAGEVVATEREADLSEATLRELLRLGSVQFVVANVGAPLRWVPGSETFEFWKSEVRPHLADPSEDGHHLGDFPDSYFYYPTRWRWSGAASLVVLEMHH